jgi:hypothetical protein
MYPQFYQAYLMNRFVIIAILLTISIATLFFGLFHLIENKSPENLVSLQVLSLSFITYFKYHLMVIAGAFGITFSLWLKDQH